MVRDIVTEVASNSLVGREKFFLKYYSAPSSKWQKEVKSMTGLRLYHKLPWELSIILAQKYLKYCSHRFTLSLVREVFVQRWPLNHALFSFHNLKQKLVNCGHLMIINTNWIPYKSIVILNKNEFCFSHYLLSQSFFHH